MSCRHPLCPLCLLRALCGPVLLPIPLLWPYVIQNHHPQPLFGWYYTFTLPLHRKKLKEGNEDRSLLLFYYLNMDPQTQSLVQSLEHKVNSLISTEPDLFLVEVRIKPTNNIKVFIDGDQGVSIERLVQFNRRLYKQLEEEGIFPNGDFSLEVSSPGLDEPVKLHRQYLKNTGRFVEVTDKEGQKIEGKLVQVTDQEIVLEEQRGKGKKLEMLTHSIPFDSIKTTKIQIKF